MNIPSPAVIKKQIDQRKAFESYEKDVSSASASVNTVSDTSSRSKKSRGTSVSQGHGRQNSNPSKTNSSQTQKKEFVRPEHLTTKPLRNDPKLTALRNSLTESDEVSEDRRARIDSLKEKIQVLRERNVSVASIAKRHRLTINEVRDILGYTGRVAHLSEHKAKQSKNNKENN